MNRVVERKTSRWGYVSVYGWLDVTEVHPGRTPFALDDDPVCR